MGCYQSPDGQGQFGDPEGETFQLPGSVWIRTQVPLVELESKSFLLNCVLALLVYILLLRVTCLV